MNSKKHAGFTYVELVIAVGIIGILSIIVVVSYQNAQKTGRDRQRMSDLAQIAAALETYFSRYGFYPPSTGSAENSCDSSLGSGSSGCTSYDGSYPWGTSSSKGDLYTGLVTNSKILTILPQDPINKRITIGATTYNYFYKYEPNTPPGNTCPAGWPTNKGCGYYLIVELEGGGSEKRTGGHNWNTPTIP